jgi:hypothetical protein
MKLGNSEVVPLLSPVLAMQGIDPKIGFSSQAVRNLRILNPNGTISQDVLSMDLEPLFNLTADQTIQIPGLNIVKTMECFLKKFFFERDTNGRTVIFLRDINSRISEKLLLLSFLKIADNPVGRVRH